MKIVGRLALVVALAGATFAITGPADAFGSGCNLTPLVPYKSGSSVVYGGTVTCSSATSGDISGAEQRQGTGTWATLSTQGTPSYYNTTVITLTATNGICTPAGTHTFRSRDTAYAGGSSATAYSSGRSINC